MELTVLFERVCTLVKDHFKDIYEYVISGQFDKMKSPFEWDIVTRGLVAMTIEGFVGFLITILCQYNFLRKPPWVCVSILACVCVWVRGW